MQPKAAAILLGANDEDNGFTGSLDELHISTRASDANSIKFSALSQREDSKLVKYGDDESRASSSSEYFGLLWAMLNSVRPEGWVIIGLIVILGFISFDIILAKTIQLGKAEKFDRQFIDEYKSDSSNSTFDAEKFDGPLSDLYITYQNEITQALDEARHSPISHASIDVIRSALDTKMVQITDELNRKIAWVTMAISGGPFLGLLGTVLGVMITFATIASSGDVNVKTIAPGVAAALTTTVLGLAVAIPSLFGYNSVAGKVTRRVTAMEVFADKLVAQAAVRIYRLESEGRRKNAA